MVVAELAWVSSSFLSLLTLGFLGCCCDQQQQQQQILNVDNDDTKRICPECGLENPRDANHCGDCGFSFDSENTGD